jgi:hypothetical protein
MSSKIRPAIRDGIIRALSAGVVPTQGLQHIQVGREKEVESVIRTVKAVSDGGSGFKMVVGDYGAGKTFFLHLVRQLAFAQKLVAVHADFSPERRLVATGGQSRALYSELINNMASRARPNGGALPGIIEGFTQKAMKAAEDSGTPVDDVIEQQLRPLLEMVSGWDFAKVLAKYCHGHDSGDDVLKLNALRWLKGEYSTKPEARKDLGVRTIIGDGTLYDSVKLMNRFIVLAGHAGMVVMLDEAVNLFKIANTQSRTSNYEMVLRMLNDTLQSAHGSENLFLLFGITPEALYDPRRGLCSYDALASRLAPNRFAQESGLIDANQPTIHLQNLVPEELFLLLTRIRGVFANGDSQEQLLTDAAIEAFMAHCNETIGSAYFKTPRETVREFANLLSMLEQYPDKDWTNFIPAMNLKTESEEETVPGADISGDEEEAFEEFKI